MGAYFTRLASAAVSSLSLSLLPFSYLPCVRCNATRRNTTVLQPKIGRCPIRGAPWIMPALCQPPWRAFDWKTVASTKRTATWKEGGSLRRKTSDLSSLQRLYGREPNEWRSTVSKSGRQANWMFGMRAVKYFFDFSLLFFLRSACAPRIKSGRRYFRYKIDNNLHSIKNFLRQTRCISFTKIREFFDSSKFYS